MAILEKVRELIMKVRKDKVTEDQVKPDALLVEDLGFDSLALVELLVLAEDAFALEIPQEEAMNRKSVAEMTAYLEGRLAG